MEEISEDRVGPQKKKTANILRWFPLKPRLQRLFMSSKTANLMKWHHLERVQDGKLQHPADALAWKDFDKKYHEFANDPRNVRLTLASDGFNPYRTMNVAYSIWPVFVILYNLPPWYVMKQPKFILSLIIPGPKGPGNKIDVYMQPLVKELEELWDSGVETFDASMSENFHLKAVVLSTISDFPGYANLSGWSTKGEYVCPLCAFDKSSRWLDHGQMWCYMGHENHHEKSLKTQNSGVVVTVVDVSYAGGSTAHGVINYYGALTDIVELNYSSKIRVVLFRCDWVDTNRCCKRDEFGITLVNFSHLVHTGTNLLDDPFVLTSQVDKVYYAHDPKSKDWFVARHVKVRDAFNMQSDTDQSRLDSLLDTFDIPNLDSVGSNVEETDGIPIMEHEDVDEDENDI